MISRILWDRIFVTLAISAGLLLADVDSGWGQDADLDEAADLYDDSDADHDDGDKASSGNDRVEKKKAKKKSKKRKKRKKRKVSYEPSYYSSLGLGKTLPGGFYRFRSVTKMARGATGFDSQGETLDLGYELNVLAQAAVLEYGMTEDLSFQVLVPYYLKNQLSFNQRQFQTSSIYQEKVASFQALMMGTLMARGACSDVATCQQALSSNQTLPPGQTITLPTGEVMQVGGVPLNQLSASIPNMVTSAATPSDGETGLGDIDMGALYVLGANRHYVFAAGGGIRLPTGSFENVPSARRGTGEGLVQGAFRVNLDLNPWRPLWVSFQNQSEFVLVSGRKKKSSLLDPNELNQEDPTSDAAIAAGSDGLPNSQEVTRDGVRQFGLLRFDLGLSDLGKSFQPMSVETQLIYDFGAETLINGVSQGPAAESLRFAYGVKFDGLGFDKPLPAYLKFTKEDFISGKNVTIAPSSLQIELSFYTSI